MRTKYHQISLKDTFSDCREMFQEDTPSFFRPLADSFDISEYIPSNFYHAFYQSFGRRHLYPLEGFLSALSCRKSFPFLPTPCSSFSLFSAGNYAISAAFPKSPTLPCFSASKLLLNRSLSQCSTP